MLDLAREVLIRWNGICALILLLRCHCLSHLHSGLIILTSCQANCIKARIHCFDSTVNWQLQSCQTLYLTVSYTFWRLSSCSFANVELFVTLVEMLKSKPFISSSAGYSLPCWRQCVSEYHLQGITILLSGSACFP